MFVNTECVCIFTYPNRNALVHQYCIVYVLT